MRTDVGAVSAEMLSTRWTFWKFFAVYRYSFRFPWAEQPGNTFTVFSFCITDHLSIGFKFPAWIVDGLGIGVDYEEPK